VTPKILNASLYIYICVLHICLLVCQTGTHVVQLLTTGSITADPGTACLSRLMHKHTQTEGYSSTQIERHTTTTVL